MLNFKIACGDLGIAENEQHLIHQKTPAAVLNEYCQREKKIIRHLFTDTPPYSCILIIDDRMWKSEPFSKKALAKTSVSLTALNDLYGISMCEYNAETSAACKNEVKSETNLVTNRRLKLPVHHNQHKLPPKPSQTFSKKK